MLEFESIPYYTNSLLIPKQVLTHIFFRPLSSHNHQSGTNNQRHHHIIVYPHRTTKVRFIHHPNQLTIQVVGSHKQLQSDLRLNLEFWESSRGIGMLRLVVHVLKLSFDGKLYYTLL